MQKHLFLTGASGIGKTSIIRKALGDKLSVAGGFIIEKIDKNRKTLGFDMLPAAAAGGIKGFESERFLDCSTAQPKSNNEVFRSLGVRLLQEAEYYPYAMLDEFGGYELIIPQFREALLEVLNNDSLPCIGVIMDIKRARQIKNSIGLGEKYLAYHSALIRALKMDPDTLVLELTRWNMKKVQDTVRCWVEEYVL